MKSEQYQHDKVMIIQLVVYWILPVSKKNYRLIAADLSKQKLDAAAVIYYIYEKSKETLLEFYKGITKVLQLV